MRKIIIKSIALFLFFSISLFLFFWFSEGDTLKMGDTKVYLYNNDIIVENFYGPSVGITGVGYVSWGEFSWNKLDEFVYKQAKKSSYPFLWVVLRYASEDQYGNKSLDAPITIGKIDVNETKKYQSYDYWHRYNKTYYMWEKDKREYDRHIESITRKHQNSRSPFIVPSYKPKSIR